MYPYRTYNLIKRQRAYFRLYRQDKSQYIGHMTTSHSSPSTSAPLSIPTVKDDGEFSGRG